MTPRYLAVKALVRQEQSGYANLVLDAELRRCDPPLSARDAAFAANIFYTVLARRNLLDALLGRFTKKPVAQLDPPVRAVLRAGLAQARFIGVPVPAAVNESVKLAKAFGKTSAAGMVNAVLRRAAACAVSPEDWPDLGRRLTVYYSLSAPVAALLAAQYGAEAEPLAAAFYDRPATALRVNTLKTDDAALAAALTAEGCVVTPGPWPHCLTVNFAGGPAATAAFRAGQYHLQSLPSQLAAMNLAARPGMRVLDLCAAPGGKSLTLAYAMQNKGTLDSGEGVKSRLPLLQKAFARCGVTCAEAFWGDASVYDAGRGLYDRVLCDVPCSGLGTIAKKPDIRYKDLDGLDGLQILQKKILQNGARYLAQNGRLVYSTCTVNFFENQAVIRDFLSENPDFEILPPRFSLPGADTGGYGTLFLPHKTGTEGFFIAVLARKSEKTPPN